MTALLTLLILLIPSPQDPPPSPAPPPAGSPDELRDLRERVRRLEEQAAETGKSKAGNLLSSLAERLELTGEIRVRNEYRSLKDYKSLENMRTQDDQTLLRTRLGLGATITDWLSLTVGIQDSRVFGEEASVTSDDEGLDLHVGYMEIRLPMAAEAALKFRLGRQEIRLGSGRLVAERPWSNTGSRFDGLRITGEMEGWQVHGFLATIRESAGTEDEDRLFAGTHLTGRPAKGLAFDLYLYHRLHADESFVGEMGDPGDLRETTAGIRGSAQSGGWDGEIELAHQFGERAEDDVHAWMAVIRGGYALDHSLRPRLWIGYEFASGDRDPDDGHAQGFDDLYGLRHAVLGLADYTGRSNLHDLYAGIGAEPVENLALELSVHRFRLHTDRDAWRASDLSAMRRDTSGESDRDLATELDLTARFRVKPHFDFQAGGAWFWAGPYVEDTTGRDKDAWWCYLQATASF